MKAIGIDTGSTSTDAVIYDLENKKILAFSKSMTTHDHLETGIRNSLNKLPRELILQSSCLSLSTTLATNACVEKKGADICLLFIGASKRAVEWTLSSYGFESMEFMRFIEGDPSKNIPPDWEALDRMLPEIVSCYDGIAIAQIFARENDGLYEHQARERIAKAADIPVTCSYDIFRELNVIKRGAGALLNARIAPEIERFFEAIHQVLKEEDINIPVFIMRSDGSLVSENYTLQYPVETLVCGPTASAKGAVELFHEQQAVVVDMGGTTCDMAILREGQPKLDDEGIKLAGWQTFVKGVSIETIGLGGDCHVTYRPLKIILNERRAIPVCVLAAKYPEMISELQRAAENPKGSFIPLYEHFVLMRDIKGDSGRWTDTDLRICDALSKHPLSICQLGEALGTDAYHLNTENLEQQGVVLRCAFTPTDAILLKGDGSDPDCGAYGEIMNDENAFAASDLALQFISASSGLDRDFILDEIYRQIREKLYCQLVNMLWRDQRKKGDFSNPPAQLTELAKEAFAQAFMSGGNHFYKPSFSTDAILLGTGAPTHIFLPEVAKALHTKWRTSEYSSISNALGAVLGNVCVYETVSIRTDYINPKADKGSGIYIVYGVQKEAFEELDDAVERAAQIAEEKAQAKALVCGAKEITSLGHEVRRKISFTYSGIVPMGADVVACAKGRII